MKTIVHTRIPSEETQNLLVLSYSFFYSHVVCYKILYCNIYFVLLHQVWNFFYLFSKR